MVRKIRKVRTTYRAGKYRIVDPKGGVQYLNLTAQQAKVLFQLHSVLGIQELELLDGAYAA